jgi:PX domain
VSAKVADLSKSKAGAPRGDNAIYVIETSPFKWKVNRTFKDFQWLYKSLNGKYPANFVGFGETDPDSAEEKVEADGR